MPERNRLPSTLSRSSKGAQNTWARTRDSAERTYGAGQRANQAAYASLKRTFDKVGDHWERKRRSGPSDRQAQRRGAAARSRPRATADGVDANASKAHLDELARRMDIRGRSTMTKAGLVTALRRASRRETARARKR
ncbi:MAG TPA: ChaB family protein [Mycobacteriales bacterium]|nr:ChaB family protein [Mycobacteriales bacterium]